MLLIKQHPSTNLTYLYLILYRKSIDSLFSSHKLYRLLDYSIDIITTNNGILALEVVFYTKEARRLSRKIKHLHIPLTTPLIGLGVAEMTAKFKKGFTSTSSEALYTALKELHGTPWLDNNDSMLTTITNSPAVNILAFSNAAPQPTTTLTVTIKLHTSTATSHPELQPLFAHLAHFILTNAQAQAVDYFGLHSGGITATGPSGAGFCATIYIPATSRTLMATPQRLQHMLAFFIDFTHTMYQYNLLHKYIHSLTKYAPITITGPVPDYQQVINNLRATASTKGQDTMTIKNHELLLSNVSFCVSYDGKKMHNTVNKSAALYPAATRGRFWVIMWAVFSAILYKRQSHKDKSR